MANNEFIEVVSSDAYKNLKQLEAGVDSLTAKISNAVAEQNKLSAAFRGASKPSEYKANISGSNTAIQQANNIAKAVERQRLAELRLQKQREQAFDKYEKQLVREQQKLAQAQSIYSKVQQKLNQLNAEYRDLAVRKEITGKLTTEEAKRYDYLSGRITKYDTTLKAVDASMGKYQRNVGNYASGFSPLSNSINQLTREMPAFTHSVQTGFLALSNNIPIFFDAMQQVIAQNRILQAEGKPTQSVLKQLGTAVFGLGTALSVGVTLLTLYGDEIVEWAGGLFKGTQAINATKEATKQLDDIRKESLKSVVQERQELANNLAIAQDTTLSLKDRKIAAQAILDQYPYYFKALGEDAILNGKVADAVNKVNEALLARALANAAITKIEENQAKFIDADIRREAILKDITKAEKELRTIQNRSYAASNAENQAQREAEALGKVQNLKRQLVKTEEEIKALNEINNELTKYSIEQAKEAVGLQYQDKQAKKENKEEEIQAETNSRVAFERNISALEQKLSLMSKENAAYGLLKTQLDIVKNAYELLYGEQEKQEEAKNIKYGTEDFYNDVIKRLKDEQSAVADNAREYSLYQTAIDETQKKLDELTGKKEKVKELNDELAKFFQQVTASSLNDIGFGSLNTFFDGTFNKLWEQADTTQERFALMFHGITNVAKDTFRFLQQNQQAYFDAQYANLDRQQEIEMEFARGNEEGRREIERQYEEKRREIRIKEAKAQKEAAIFNAVINVAQGVTAALATANIPLSILIGVLGAAQIAMISAREIPAYAEGTDYHKGGLALVGDGGKHEAIFEPSKGWSISPNKDTLVNLERGAKVYPDLVSSGLLDAGLPNVHFENSGLTESQMRGIMQEAFSSISTVNSYFDKNGFSTWVTKGNTRKQHLNKVVTFKGIKVN